MNATPFTCIIIYNLAVGDNCDLVDNGGEDTTIGASTMTVGTSTNADFEVVRVLDNQMVEVKIV